MSRHVYTLATIAVLVGCAPTETGNPGEESGVVVLGLTAHTTDPTAVAIGMSEGGLAVTTARLRLESISVTPCDPARSDVLVEVESVVELTEGGEVELPAGEACGLSVTVVSGGDAGAAAFVMDGVRADGVPVRLTSQASTTISVAPSSGTLDLSAHLAPFLAINLAAWLGSLQLDTIAPDATGSLLVETSTHPSVVEGASTALATSATLHFDSDGDGTLSAEELHEVAAGHP